jgi:hypothetical protein
MAGQLQLLPFFLLKIANAAAVRGACKASAGAFLRTLCIKRIANGFLASSGYRNTVVIALLYVRNIALRALSMA